MHLGSRDLYGNKNESVLALEYVSMTIGKGLFKAMLLFLPIVQDALTERDKKA